MNTYLLIYLIGFAIAIPCIATPYATKRKIKVVYVEHSANLSTFYWAWVLCSILWPLMLTISLIILIFNLLFLVVKYFAELTAN